MLVLSPTATEMLESFLSEETGCNCINFPPCSHCTDPANPANLLEDEELWIEKPKGDFVCEHYTRKDLEEML